MVIFKVGDRVRCIATCHGNNGVEVGAFYTVRASDPEGVTLNAKGGWYLNDRFEFVSNTSEEKWGLFNKKLEFEAWFDAEDKAKSFAESYKMDGAIVFKYVGTLTTVDVWK